jgi:hypothetical protein
MSFFFFNKNQVLSVGPTHFLPNFDTVPNEKRDGNEIFYIKIIDTNKKIKKINKVIPNGGQCIGYILFFSIYY